MNGRSSLAVYVRQSYNCPFWLFRLFVRIVKLSLVAYVG